MSLSYLEIHQKAKAAGYDSATCHRVASIPAETTARLKTAEASHRRATAELDALRSQALNAGINPGTVGTTTRERSANTDKLKSGIMKQKDARAAIESRQAELNQLRAAAGLPAQAPVKPGPSILTQTHIKQTIADLDARIAALKAPRPTATAPKVRPVAAVAVATAKPSAAAAAPAGLTRQEFSQLPPAARLKFCRDGGKFVDATDGKTLAAYQPPTLTRAAFNALTPPARLAHIKSGGRLSD
jgi:hypothetical protein